MNNTKTIRKEGKFSVVNLADNMIPQVTEDTKTRYSWVPFGVFGQDDFWDAVVMAYNDSTTNATSVNNLADLIFGKGLFTTNPDTQKAFERIIPQEETKRVCFDLKLYGNSAYQVYWNDDHTKIVKMYHIPVQTLRAEKLYDNTRVEYYYYCTDWKDQRKVKDKIKIPAFGTSNEKREILYIKDYSPNLYYYSLPDWVSALQFAIAEAELSNLHINTISNGFLPTLMINFNNGVPAPEERQTIEDLLYSKFTGTNNGGRFMVSLIINNLTTALSEGGIEDLELYFDQLTPLVILSQTAEETGKSIEQVEDEVNDSMATPDQEADPNIQEETINDDEELELIRTHGPSSKYFTKN